MSTATSIDVERLFSHGRLLLTHVCSRLSVQSTRALLCIRAWSQLNLIANDDVRAMSELPDIQGDEQELKDGWNHIVIN